MLRALAPLRARRTGGFHGPRCLAPSLSCTVVVLRSSFRGGAQHRTRNDEIPGSVLSDRPGMTTSPLRVPCAEAKPRGAFTTRRIKMRRRLDGILECADACVNKSLRFIVRGSCAALMLV